MSNPPLRLRRTLGRVVTVSFILALGAVACGPSAGPAPGPVAPAPAPTDPVTAPTEDPESRYQTLPPEQRTPPPPEGITPEWSFPTQHHATLDNGLELNTVERHSLPIAEIRLVLRSGQSTDGDRPGLAVIAGEMLKVGGTGVWTSQQLLDRVESLGTSLDLVTDRDVTRLALRVPSDQLDAALTLLGEVVRRPRFLDQEFQKLKRREKDRVDSMARSNAGWAATMMLYRELFRIPKGMHPYARYDAMAADIDRLRLPDAKQWVSAHVTPKNAFLVVSGDVTPERVAAAAKAAFGKWRGAAPKRVVPTVPAMPSALNVFLVDRPESSQAEVRVATLGPGRSAPEWTALKVTNQVLGGGVSGRLFLDVREKRSLAYSTYSGVTEVVHGPSPIVLSAGTQTAKAGLALAALLEHYDRLGREPVVGDELATATRYLSDVFLLRVETAGAIAGMTAQLRTYGLPDDHFDVYRKQIQALAAGPVPGAAARFFTPGKALVVVAGDAARLARPLSHFGTVTIVDPTQGFSVVKIVNADPSAPIELERIDGT